ncbi:MAG: acetolactate decarboxylase [Methanospirillum sp.]
MQRNGIIVAVVLAIGAIVLAIAGMGMAAQETGRDRLYQVSTIDALLQGVYDGTVTVAALQREGDIGTGTFDRLDGELTMLDGVVWQARADGSVSRAPANETTPFAAVTRFRPDRTGALGLAGNLSGLEQRLGTFLSSPNLFAMVRVDGTFDYVKVRAAPAQTKPYPRLADAIAQQGVRELRNVSGTLVGTYTPPYATGVAITGWHLHFLSADRRSGGHILDLATDGTPRVGIDDISSFTVVLPVGTDFTGKDFSQNLSSDLQVVEKGK